LEVDNLGPGRASAGDIKVIKLSSKRTEYRGVSPGKRYQGHSLRIKVVRNHHVPIFRTHGVKK
jgi:hypothetical protein